MARTRTASQVDPEHVVRKSVGIGGGVNLRDAITQLALDEARELQNGVLDERGGFTKRLGCLSKGTFGATADRVLSWYVFYRATLAPQVLMHTTAGKLYYTNDPLADPITWTEIATGLSTTAPMSYETFNSKCYFSNGVDNYGWWDGTAYATSASAPKGKYLRLWRDTMWVSGITGFPDRVYSSDAGNAESFPVAGWVDIAKGDGDQCTTLASDGLFLIVGKRDRGFIIYDPVELSNRVVDFEKGFESHFGVVQFEGQTFYITRRGICMWLNDTPGRIISGKLDPLFYPQVTNLARMETAWSYTVENQIGWALPEVGEQYPTLQVEYYPRLVGLSRSNPPGVGPFAFQRIPASRFVRYRFGADDVLLAAHNASNKILHVFAETGTDDGEVFESVLESGAIDFEAPSNTKYLRRLRFVGRGSFTAQLKRNFEDVIVWTKPIDLSLDQDTWDETLDIWSSSNVWAASADLKVEVVHPDVYARFFTLRMTDSGENTGEQRFWIGGKQFTIPRGGWTILMVVTDAYVLGVRDQ